MLSWSVVFVILALFAGILGFTDVAGATAGIGKILFVLFLILLLASAFSGTERRNSR